MLLLDSKKYITLDCTKEIAEITKEWRERNYGGYPARTLDPSFVNENSDCFELNSSGWYIRGEIQEDYYEWVNEFEAWHPIYGMVFGNYEESLSASTEEGLIHFMENHPPDCWDYWSI